MDPLWLKYAHILGAILIFGTGLGTAFHMWCAHLTREPRVIAAVGRSTVLADWLFTTPAVDPAAGHRSLLAWTYGWSLLEPWLLASLALYVLTGLCWLPVVWIQIADAADGAAACATARPYRPLPSLRLDLVCPWLAGVPGDVRHHLADDLQADVLSGEGQGPRSDLARA